MNNRKEAKMICSYQCAYHNKDCDNGCETFKNVLQMAKHKDEQFKQLLIEKTKLLSPSAAQDSVKRCTIEEIYREMFNEEIPNSNPYYKKVGEYKTTTK